MRNVFLVLFFGLFFLNSNAQLTRPQDSMGGNMYQNDSTQHRNERKVTIDGKTNYKDYKVISIKNDTSIIDTTLTLKKLYKFNYIRKDNFELMAFHNQGQTYNKLGYEFQDSSVFPSIGFNAKQYNYYTLNDISYYYVPTPTSELMYRKGLQQGQVLDALLTANPSKQLNVSIAFKGLRSLGKYKHAISSHRNFRGTFNYHTKNKRYFVRGHMYNFDLINDENGGLTPQSVSYFESNDPNYSDRSRLDVNFTDAENNIKGKRFYIDQVVTLFSNRSFEKKSRISQIKPVSRIDSLRANVNSTRRDTIKINRARSKNIENLALKNIDSKLAIDSIAQPEKVTKNDSIQTPIAISENSITAMLNNSDTIKAIDSLALVTKKVNSDSINIANAEEKQLFNLKLGNSLMYETKHYGFSQKNANSFFGEAYENEVEDRTSYQNFNGQLYLELNSIYTGRLKFKTHFFTYNYYYNSILYFDDYTISNQLKGNAFSIGAEWLKTFGNLELKADASTILFGDINGNTLKTAISYQQDSLFNVQGFVEFTSKAPDFNKQLYQSDYIAYNWQNNFGNEKITTFGGAFNSEKWASVEASYNVINNYTFFNKEATPEQADETLNYFKVKLLKAFNYRKFTLDNTVMYQSVLSGESFFRVPTWVTRNTLAFSTNVFKGNPLYLETGITFSYFSSYKMNAYNPLISEFYIQNSDKIGNFPMLDFFLNLRIQRTRFYLQLENFSASFTGRDYYSAPSYPYRDLTFRIGLVWNFFI